MKWKNVLKISRFVVFLAVSMQLQAVTSVTFQSENDLQRALEPFSFEEVVLRMSKAKGFDTIYFEYGRETDPNRTIPIRNSEIGNLLKSEVWKTKFLTVFYPESPRVPHHLTIALNRSTKGISDVSVEENAELFATIKKIAEIYKTISIQGFVIAQFDTPQEGHLGRHVVELIPHLPGFNSVKNIVDKVDCNRYVLFRTANLAPIRYRMQQNEISNQLQFWRGAFQKAHAPISIKDSEISFPYIRKEAYLAEAKKIAYQYLLEILQDKGALIEEDCFEPVMPTVIPNDVVSVTVDRCAFCNPDVIERQFVYEYGGISVFYNIRKIASDSACFLVLPKRHTEKVYGLTSNEIHNLGIVRRALVEILKEAHPERQVIIYTQDDPAVGQTVFHSHEQVVALNPQTIPFTWMMMDLYPGENASLEEMEKVRKEFGSTLEKKIREITGLEKKG